MYLPADLSKTLKRIPWFLELTQDQLECLSAITVLHDLEPGDVLFKEGDREDFLFILLEGQIILNIEVPNHGQVPFYTAEALDVIGWSSLTPIVRQRTCTARATQRCLLLGFQSKLLQQMCDEDHALGYVVMKRLSNVVATRLLTTRVCLMEMIADATPQATGLP